jgi:hypothetical protein
MRKVRSTWAPCGGAVRVHQGMTLGSPNEDFGRLHPHFGVSFQEFFNPQTKLVVKSKDVSMGRFGSAFHHF